MNNFDSNTISNILIIVLGIMIFILIVLSLVFIVIRTKEKKIEKGNNKIKEKPIEKGKKVNKNKENDILYSKQSIMDFMEFDKVEDNMIVQKNGKRFLMIVECQGVNYDLMSKMEKVGVEEGFQQFLNSLRHPIQIYIQTRTINLEKSILTYKDKVNDIENKYDRMLYEYSKIKSSENYSKEDVEKYLFEITKQRNLLEYGRDIVVNTEKMSLNRSVLNKKYYVIIPYFSEEIGSDKYDKEEIKNMAFSELYTKSQSIVRTLSSCSISGKILSSKELIELLYEAYNRDESESFGIDKALRAEYDSLYSTSQDVFEKKMRVLDNEIESNAIDLANRAVEKVKSRTQQEAEKKESSLEELVRKMAQIVLEENKEYVGEEVANKAIEEIKEGGVESDEEIKKTTRGRKKKSDK